MELWCKGGRGSQQFSTFFILGLLGDWDMKCCGSHGSTWRMWEEMKLTRKPLSRKTQDLQSSQWVCIQPTRTMKKVRSAGRGCLWENINVSLQFSTFCCLGATEESKLQKRTRYIVLYCGILFCIVICGTFRSWGHLRPKISLLSFCMKTHFWWLKSSKIYSLMTKNAKKCRKMV